tara:strand:+ start:428 stop:556 length:129 start_codon:yes stop_codon:yes gene_type:complete
MVLKAQGKVEGFETVEVSLKVKKKEMRLINQPTFSLRSIRNV